jgi:hypothetical protein
VRPQLAVLAVLLPAVAGCAAQAAVAGGVVANEPTWSQSDQVSVALAAEGVPFHLGWELESHAEGERGSVFTTGLEAGYALTPAPVLGAVGVLAHADYGFPTGAGPAGGYAGVTVALPISIESSDAPFDRNRYFKLLSTRMELGPMARYRAYWSWEPTSNGGDEAVFRHDLSLGAVFRMRLTSDLLPGGG